MASATVLALTGATFAGGSNCCFANGGLGCDDPVCQDTVCAVDPFCCSNTWDQICANQALSLCGDLCAGGSNCCIANGGLGCDDPVCQDAVCAVDPFCCSNTWDQICANQAASLCGDLCGGGGGGICSSSANDCCVANGTPGCSDETCCNAVCAADPFCCSVAWDGICAGSAAVLCLDICGSGCDVSCPAGADSEQEACGEDTNGGCNAPPTSGSTCCIANGGLGCDDPVCQDTVCAADPFCCTTAWDGICAGAAATLCGDLCSAAAAYEPITPGTPMCGTFWADGSFRDTDWYSFSLSAPANVTLSVNALIPVTIALLDSNCPPQIFVIAGLNTCPSEVTWCLDAGDYTAFVAPGVFNGVPCGSGDANNYVATLTVGDSCVPLACGSPSAGDCCTAQATPYCNDAECCDAVCAADPFCCTTAWDGLCAQSAQILCAVCESACDVTCPAGSAEEAEACGDDSNGGCNAPPTSGSTCCIANGGIGCDDPVCQDAVCGADPFCCSVAWDGICAGAAATLCGDLCSAAAAYEPISAGTICGTFWADGSFRDTDWYSFTLTETTSVTWSVNAKIPVTLAILDNNCPPFIFTIATLNACPSEVSACLEAGTYTAFVAPGIFNGLPCGTGEKNNYVATLSFNGSCEPLGCGSTSAGDCCVAQATPFCNDADCCTTVCAADPFCCSVAWDGLCAGQAASLCGDLCGGGGEPPVNDECTGATTIGVGGTAFNSTGATGVTTLPASCDSFGSVDIFNDVWFKYVATGTGSATVSTCNAASFDTRLGIFSGACDALAFVACNDDGAGCAGFTSSVTFNTVCGETYYISLGAFANGTTGTGTLTVTQTGTCPPACPADLDGDGSVGAADLAILLGQWGGPGTADFNASGTVDAADLATLLGEWGPC
jgi:hypothetical protein